MQNKWEPDKDSLRQVAHVSTLPQVAGVHIATADAAPDENSGQPLARLVHPDELMHAVDMSESRRASFTLGRIALRAAVAAVDTEAALRAMLPGPRGAPQLPQGVAASLSHKGLHTVAVAAVANSNESDIATLGVDIELLARQRMPHQRLAKRILTPEEFDALPDDAEERANRILLHFSLKEAVYKAIHPLVRRYVGFREVSLIVNTDFITSGGSDSGTATVQLLLPELRDNETAITTRWWKDGVYVTAVAVTHGGGSTTTLR